MTTTAGSHQSSAARPGQARRVLGSILLGSAGVLLTLLALPVCLLLGAPVAGWAIGAVAVAANRIVHALVSWSVRDSSVTVTLGAMGFSMMIRAGLTALALFFVGARLTGLPGDRLIGFDRPDLARVAIIVFLIGFTIDTAIDAIRRASDRDHLATARETTA